MCVYIHIYKYIFFFLEDQDGVGNIFLENKSISCSCIKQPVSGLCILIQCTAMKVSRCFNGLLQTFILNPLKVPNYAKLASPMFCSNNNNLRAEM